MKCYMQSKVQQNIQKFESGNVHNATQQKTQKEHVCNHGQVANKVQQFETVAFLNQLDAFCEQNASQLQKMASLTGGIIILC